MSEPISNSMTISNEAVEAHWHHNGSVVIAPTKQLQVSYDVGSPEMAEMLCDMINVSIKSAITRACAERDESLSRVTQQRDDEIKANRRYRNHISYLSAQLAVMKEALEEFAKETESVPCDDPQCGDSTWDHACTAGRRKPTKRAEKAIAALSNFPAAAPKDLGGKRGVKTNTVSGQNHLHVFPLVARFQRARWSLSRCKIHDLSVGEEVLLSKFDRNNIITSIERIEEAYENTRRYHTRTLDNGILVRRSL